MKTGDKAIEALYNIIGGIQCDIDYNDKVDLNLLIDGLVAILELLEQKPIDKEQLQINKDYRSLDKLFNHPLKELDNLIEKLQNDSLNMTQKEWSRLDEFRSIGATVPLYDKNYLKNINNDKEETDKEM